jgi:hypothetical protein
MADHVISFTAAEESVLTRIATLTGLTAEQIIDKYGKTAIRSQALQYLKEACHNAVDEMTVTEQLNLLGG